MRNNLNKYIFLCTIGLLAACDTKKNTPDVSHIPINVKIERFDQQLARIDTNNAGEGIKLLEQQYPSFAPVYFREIMEIVPWKDSARTPEMQIRGIVASKDFRVLQDSVNTHFNNIKPVETSLTQAFRLTKHYFPKFNAPRVVSFISAIGNYGAITIDSTLGLGLDMYLGEDFPFYAMIPDYPAYVIRRFTPENITVNAMKVLQQQYYPSSGEGSQLIDQMIDLGKQQYFLEKVLPDDAEYLRLGYTKEQLKFCNDNEEMIWQFFIQHKLLYTNDWQDVMRYVGEGPSTQGMPPGAPGQIAAFTGYRIVQKYMEKNPEVTLEKLMSTPGKTVLNGAKYRPK